MKARGEETIEPFDQIDQRFEQIEKRKAVLRRRLLLSFIDHISRAPDGVNKWNVKLAIDLGAEATYKGLNDAGLGIKMKSPYLLQDHFSGHQSPRVPHQHFKKFELSRGQLDFATVADNCAR